jgi:hypothetical protein
VVGKFSGSEHEAWAAYDEATKEEGIEKWATHGIYQVVGNCEITDNNPNSPKQCRKMYGFIGCVKTHLHDKTTLDGVNHRRNAYIKKNIRRCFNARCPKCVRS